MTNVKMTTKRQITIYIDSDPGRLVSRDGRWAGEWDEVQS